MKGIKMSRFSQVVTVFHDRMLPEQGLTLVGYAALIEHYELKVPLPDICAALSQHHKRYETEHWSIYTPRYKPEDTLIGHLTFALKHEGINLAVLKALFSKIDPKEIEIWVRSKPSGRHSRRAWFLYEWLTKKKLDLNDVKTGRYVDVLDPKQQYPGPAVSSKRHRIRNNLPGMRDFCPLVRRTEKLKKYEALKLNVIVRKIIKKTRHDLLSRASSFLLLKDSRASFEIERERPEHARAERWGQVIGQAGCHPLSKEELLRLQKMVLEENRFITFGFRKEGGFIGTYDRVTGDPIPDHVSARWNDIDQLLNGMLVTYQHLKNDSIDPIIFATMIAFGFVFIHPFVDGNGRIHRYLIQHILAVSGFVPKKVVFPISAVILERIEEYRKVLESYSIPRLRCIAWRPTDRGNIEVLNETIDLYRYFDATKHAEFLYGCMDQAVKKSFPEEIDYLERYDRMKVAVKELFDMPDNMVHLLIRFLEQNDGVLSKRVRGKEFKALSSDECQQLEELHASIFKQ